MSLLETLELAGGELSTDDRAEGGLPMLASGEARETAITNRVEGK